MEPCDYIASLPSKKIRNFAIDALDIWYKVPDTALDIITYVIEMLHNSSLIIDDIEDNSTIRRGMPSAHMVFGMSESINTASFLFAKCLQAILKLSSGAAQIYAEELANLHLGQGLELRWTFYKECPSEEQYMQMVDGKTGGLFRFAGRLMKLEATQNKNLDVDDLLTLMGRYFQIRDDYQNLGSKDYALTKGSLTDLDEGKYSFILIHALNNTRDAQLRGLLELRSRTGGMTAEQKKLAMTIIGRTKSMEYTQNVLKELQEEIKNRLEELEAENKLGEPNWMLRAIMSRLRVDFSWTSYIL
ncbi:hypothetical protein TWF694_003618 [Orbilia ellipsospora]|uniref:Uncharacterized protein n=1 Tax=Orbilia ellipsospora TaxID=2528407 RepID=A0AAV9WZ32_9PEZI